VDDPAAALARSSSFADLKSRLSSVYRPRLLIHGREGMGQALIASAILYKLEQFPISPLDMPTLFANPGARVSLRLIAFLTLKLEC
jgi:hypothetical protein